MRSNPCAPVRRSSLPWRVCRSDGRAQGAAVAAGAGAAGQHGRADSAAGCRRRSRRIGPRATSTSAWRNYLCQAQQKWTVTPVPNAGGYPGSPYFKITIAGTDRALAATADAEVVVLPAFTGGPEQLWRIDQLADGTWRIMPKSIPNSKETFVLSAVGSSSATLAKFDPRSEKQRWLFKTP